MFQMMFKLALKIHKLSIIFYNKKNKIIEIKIKKQKTKIINNWNKIYRN